MSSFFLSDAHLGVSPAGAVPEREIHLAEFIKGLRGRATRLFIVGDLFEFWYEYDFYTPSAHFKILKNLAELRESGCKITLLKGNHDFGFGNFFSEQLGIETVDYCVEELEGRRVYVCHGDGLAGIDGSYRFLKKILNFRFNRFLFKWLHPDLGMRLALAVGSNSRDFNKKRIVPEEEYLENARVLMRKNNCDTLVHGHNHTAGIWKVPEGLVINCGNYLFNENYLEIRQKICYICDSLSAVPNSAC
ncbi:UDP-2,3-diacylglucosamine hydrolase [Fibrobacterales bacterium]|nr:UDP-2,3-diacylglucosamine hydrolase [Fibrobacterales bacterium]